MTTHAKHQVSNVAVEELQSRSVGWHLQLSLTGRRVGWLAAALLALAVAGCGGGGGGSTGSGASGGSGGSGAGGSDTGGSDSTGSGAGGSSGADCGGITGAVCSDTEYCDFADGALCGAGDQLGTCQPKPDACTADCPGVCGCDGQFYCNACNAASEGIDVDPSGTCTPDDPTECGGIAGLACADNQYCDFPDDALCGAADQLGSCKVKPDVCTKDCPGVCGCDGQSYCNECEAAKLGIDTSSGVDCSP